MAAISSITLSKIDDLINLFTRQSRRKVANLFLNICQNFCANTLNDTSVRTLCYTILNQRTIFVTFLSICCARTCSACNRIKNCSTALTTS